MSKTAWQSFYDKRWIGAWDLSQEGKDSIVEIERVEAHSIQGTTGDAKKAPVIFFKGKSKGLVCNVTNARTVAKLYGKFVEEWTGKKIALFATQTQSFGETVDCVRVRPFVPVEKSAPLESVESPTLVTERKKETA